MLVAMVCVAGSFSAGASDVVRRSSGYIAKIQGQVSIGEAGQAEAVLLDREADRGRRIYPGQRLRCEKGGKVLLHLSDGDRLLTHATGWFTVPQPRITATRDARQKALDAYVRVGGRDRAVRPLRLFSPADHGAVIPRRFTIRWTPDARRCSLSFAIRDADGVLLWHQEGVRDDGGVIEPVAARDALQRYRADKPGDSAPLMLELRDACGNESSVVFRLLSLEGERDVDDQLQSWASEGDMFLRRLGRASVFDDAGMYPEAALDYEAALALAPKGRDILLRSIAAHRLTGNDARADQLQRRLPPGTPVR
jgi:hypothetical protein